MVTNRQGTLKPAKKPTKAQLAERQAADEANNADVERSVNEWRVSQGLPPRVKEATNG